MNYLFLLEKNLSIPASVISIFTLFFITSLTNTMCLLLLFQALVLSISRKEFRWFSDIFISDKLDKEDE